MVGQARACSGVISASTRCATALASRYCTTRSALCASAARPEPRSKIARHSTAILEESVDRAPAQQQVGPDRIRLACGARDTEAVAAGLENMNRRRDIGGAQGGKIGQAVLDRRHDRIVGGQAYPARRCIDRHVLIAGISHDLFRRWIGTQEIVARALVRTLA